MALQYGLSLRQAQVNAIETTVGASPTMEIRSGAPPANCAAADSGSVLATIALPADWLTSADATATVSKVGTWEDLSADASGTPGHFRIKQGATCHLQGTVGVSASDMIVDSATFTAGQHFSVNTFSISAGNA